MSIKQNTNKIIEKLEKSKRYFIHRSLINDNMKLIRGTFHKIIYNKCEMSVSIKDSIYIIGEHNYKNICKKQYFPLLWIIKIETLSDILQSFTHLNVRKLPSEIWQYIDEFL